MGNYCYVAVCSAVLGDSAPTEGGEGQGHVVAASRLQHVEFGKTKLSNKVLCETIKAQWIEHRRLKLFGIL